MKIPFFKSFGAKNTTSIQLTLTIFVLALLTLILGAHSLYSYVNLYKKAQAEQKKEAAMVAKLISGIAGNSLLTQDYTMLDDMIQLAIGSDEVVFVKIFDKSGTIIRDQNNRATPEHSIEVRQTIFVAESPAGEVLVGYSTEDSYRSLVRDVKISLLVLCIALASSTFLMVLMLKSLIITPIAKLNETTSEIATGDLTKFVELHRSDELATLGGSINSMTSNLKEMILRIKGITTTIEDSTDELSASSKNVLSGAGGQRLSIVHTANAAQELDATVISVAEGSESLRMLSREVADSLSKMNEDVENISQSAGVFSESAEEASSSIQQMMSNVNLISENLQNITSSSQDVASTVTEMSVSVREIEESANKSVSLAERVSEDASEKGIVSLGIAMQGIDEIKSNVGLLSDSITRLGKKSEDIGNILDVIREVTDQTALLSLNAAILAAQAGEFGMGFSVVADEIKKLAVKTADSTTEIAILVQSVQEETRTSIEAARKSINAVEKGSTLFKDVSKALDRILESSQESTDMSRMIQRATSEQASAIKQITSNVTEMNFEIGKIAEALAEQTQGSRFIVNITEEIKRAAEQTNSATGAHAANSKGIDLAMKTVADQTSHIADATNIQKIKTAEIIKSIEEIRLTSEEFLALSNRLDSSIAGLKSEAGDLGGEISKFKM